LNLIFLKQGYFKKLFIIINLFNSLLILICCLLNNYYHPVLSNISFLTFLFPAFYLVNICFFVYWSLKMDLRVLLSLLIFASLYFSSYTFYRITDNFQEKKEGFHVMSFNARLFNHYNWIKKDSIPFKIKKIFKSENPDVLSIQEYHGDYEYLLKNYKNKHIYFSGNNVGKSIHTNNKIIKKGLVEFDNSSNNAIYVDLIQKNDTIRIYNAHFESFKIDVLGLKADVVTFKNLIVKTKKAYIAQKYQLEVLISHILKSPYKTVLTVDLNNTEHSYVYKRIEKELADVFDLIGNGFGSTYEFKFMPIRIDYIFISKSISAKKFQIFNKKLSDHKPISVFLDI